MSADQTIPFEVEQSQRFFDLCFYFIYSEYIGDFKWKFLNKVKLSVPLILITFMGYCMIHDLLRPDTLQDQIKISYFITFIGTVYQWEWRYYVFLTRHGEFVKIKNFTKNLSDSLQQFNMASNIRREELPKALVFSNWFVKGFCTSTAISLVIFVVQSLLQTDFTSPMVYRIPHISETSVIYRPLNIIVQLISLHLLVFIVIGSDLLLVLIIGHINGELRTIIGLISKLENRETARKEGSIILGQIYLLHMRIHHVIDDLTTIYWQLSFHIIFSNFLYICLTLFLARFYTITFLTIAIMINGSFQLTLLCSNSQILLNKTEEIREVLWMTSWYEMSLKDQKTFLIILQMAQKQKGIDACGIITISVNTLVQVLKSAFSYAAFLYTLIQ
ncbi:hypothetical protein DMENIID0001_104820 [Sergentomyia squamirostris]